MILACPSNFSLVKQTEGISLSSQFSPETYLLKGPRNLKKRVELAYTCFQLIHNRQQNDPKDEVGFTFPLVVTVFGSGPSQK